MFSLSPSIQPLAVHMDTQQYRCDTPQQICVCLCRLQLSVFSFLCTHGTFGNIRDSSHRGPRGSASLPNTLALTVAFVMANSQLCNSLGTQYVFWRINQGNKHEDESTIQQWLGHLVRRDLGPTGRCYIRWFSLIFSSNIAIGNVSLRHVSVNFNQVMRSLVPCFTIILGLLVGKIFTGRRIASVVPIIVGVMMACFGDMEFTALGFIYTLTCVVLAAIKAVVAGEMLTGSLKLHPVDLLGHLAPLAMVQCL